MKSGCLAWQPVLTAGALTLRPWEPSDVHHLVRAYSDPDIRQWHARSLSNAQAEAWIAYEGERWRQGRGGSWAITQDDVLLGRVGIGGVSLDEAQAGMTYWVLPEVRGRGVASRALSEVVDWAFDEPRFHRLHLEHSTTNEASCAVAKAVGFLPEGTKRSGAQHFDGWHDMHLHGLLATDARPRLHGA